MLSLFQKFFLLIEIFFLLKKEKLTGTRLTHPLFAKRFRFDKSSLRRGNTPDLFLTLACIGKVSRLLRPVGPGFLSQNPSPGFLSQGPYGLSPRQECNPLQVFAKAFGRSEALVKGFYPGNKLIRRSPILSSTIEQTSERRSLANVIRFQHLLPIRRYPQFPVLITDLRAG